MDFNALLTTLSDYLFEVDRLSFAIPGIMLAMVLGVLTGPRFHNCFPGLWVVFDSIFGSLGKRLDKLSRPAADLTFRGIIWTLIAVFIAYALGHFLEKLILSFPFHGIIEIVALSLAITAGTVWYSLFRLYKALENENVQKGSYLSISRSSRIDLSQADNYAITRVGMGLSATTFSKGLIGPVLWYFIAGLPAAYMYIAIAMLAWRFGKNGYNKGFGRFPVALEKLLGFIPDMFAGFLLSLSGLFTPTGKMTAGFIGQIFSSDRAPYEEGGKSISAVAYSLKVSIGGPCVDIDGSKIPKKWVGPGDATAKLDKGHLKRAIYLNFVATLLLLASIISAILWANILGI